MQSLDRTNPAEANNEAIEKVLQITVNNHPGVMSHICGLFSRRAYNMDSILCMPLDDGRSSRVWIRVADTDKLDQIMKQLRKLEDVRTVAFARAEHEFFGQLERYFSGHRAQSVR